MVIIYSKWFSHPAVDALQLEWFALPAVSGMLFEAGGIQFPGKQSQVAVFQGICNHQVPHFLAGIPCLRLPSGISWTSRDITSARLDIHSSFHKTELLHRQTLGKSMGIDMAQPCWQDKVASEISFAVLQSFASNGVTMVDHHLQAEQFMTHFK